MTTAELSKYQVVDGTFYRRETPIQVVRLLEQSRRSGLRIRVHYGDRETGQDWGEVSETSGRVGRSTGSVRVPLMIQSARSLGGGTILDGAIVRIRHANRRDGGDLYRHPSYTPPPRADHPRDWERHFA